jgi:5-hydroxyisourate hydrolase
MSQITTHILDTSVGKPAAGIAIVLEMKEDSGTWKALGRGTTNADGRLPDLLASGTKLAPGIYRLLFATGAYFQSKGVKAFYPSVVIEFETIDQSHYHVPLLLNPFGYSTYRGS